MQRELAALASRSGEQPQGQPKQRSTSDDSGPARCDRLGGLPDVGDMKCVQAQGRKIIGLEEQINNRQQEAYVADAGDDERFFGCRRRRRAMVPEPDEQV